MIMSESTHACTCPTVVMQKWIGSWNTCNRLYINAGYIYIYKLIFDDFIYLYSALLWQLDCHNWFSRLRDSQTLTTTMPPCRTFCWLHIQDSTRLSLIIVGVFRSWQLQNRYSLYVALQVSRCLWDTYILLMRWVVWSECKWDLGAFSFDDSSAADVANVVELSGNRIHNRQVYSCTFISCTYIPNIRQDDILLIFYTYSNDFLNNKSF